MAVATCLMRTQSTATRTVIEVSQILSGLDGARLRDMAASLVTTGAIDGDAFRAAHSEIVATFAKIYPFLSELRETTRAAGGGEVRWRQRPSIAAQQLELAACCVT